MTMPGNLMLLLLLHAMVCCQLTRGNLPANLMETSTVETTTDTVTMELTSTTQETTSASHLTSMNTVTDENPTTSTATNTVTDENPTTSTATNTVTDEDPTTSTETNTVSEDNPISSPVTVEGNVTSDSPTMTKTPTVTTTKSITSPVKECMQCSGKGCIKDTSKHTTCQREDVCYIFVSDSTETAGCTAVDGTIKCDSKVSCDKTEVGCQCCCSEGNLCNTNIVNSEAYKYCTDTEDKGKGDSDNVKNGVGYNYSCVLMIAFAFLIQFYVLHRFT